MARGVPTATQEAPSRVGRGLQGCHTWAPAGRAEEETEAPRAGGTRPRSHLPAGRRSGCQPGAAAAAAAFSFGSLPAFGCHSPSCCEHGANQVLLSLFVLDSFLGINPLEWRTAGRRVLIARLSLCCLGRSQPTAAPDQTLTQPSRSRATALHSHAEAARPARPWGPRSLLLRPEEPREWQPLGCSGCCLSGRGDPGQDGEGPTHTHLEVEDPERSEGPETTWGGGCDHNRKARASGRPFRIRAPLCLGLDGAWARTPRLGQCPSPRPPGLSGFFLL